MSRVRFLTVLSLLGLLALPASLPAEAIAPSGKVSMDSQSLAAGIGFSWGSGALYLHGRKYPFSFDGVTLVDFGFSRASATGEVSNLVDLAKFNGTYFATEASIALGGGVGVLTLRNEHGVFMHLDSVSQGARFQLGASGLRVKLWHRLR